MSEIATLVQMAREGGIVRVYAMGNVPSIAEGRKYPYAVLGSSRMAPDTRTLDGGGNDPRRFVLQMYGRVAESLEDLANLALATFDCAFMPFDDEPQCRVEVTAGPYRDPDDNGVLALTQTYRY